MYSCFEMSFSQCINMPISKTGSTLLSSLSVPRMPTFLYTQVSFDLIFKGTKFRLQPIAVAARSKAWVCGRSLGGIVGSNPSGSMDVCCVCCVLLGRGLCVGPITRPEKSYRV